MKYQIFELIENRRLEPDGYRTKSVVNYTLEQDAYPSAFESVTEAEQHLRDHSKEHTRTTLVILPVYEIDYKGELNV